MNPEAVVFEARRWIGTPYHHRARVLGSGVDCAQLVIASFVAAGVFADFDPGHYTHDWHMHRGEEIYLRSVEERLRRCDDHEEPLDARPYVVYPPATVLMWRLGRTYSHSAIVSEWPFVIHAYFPAGRVQEESVLRTPMSARPMRAYDFWGRSFSVSVWRHA